MLNIIGIVETRRLQNVRGRYDTVRPYPAIIEARERELALSSSKRESRILVRIRRLHYRSGG